VLKQVLRLQAGEAEMKDTAVTVSGVAADDVSAKSIRAALRSAVPSGFKLTHQISVKETPAPAPPRTDAPASAPTIPPPEKEAQAKAPAVAAPAPFPSLELESPPPIPPTKDLEPPVQQAKPALPAPLPVPPPAAAPEAKTAKAPEPPPAVPPAKDLAPPSAPPKQEPPKAAAEPKTSVAVSPPPAATPPPAPAQDACARELAKVDTSGHILFDTNSAKLDAASFDLLNRLAAAAKSCNGLRIAIEGHADTDGSARYNKRLSVRRARAVEKYLVEAGMPRRQLETIGYGYERPAVPNDTPENMAKNRRIEFVIRR
jgi:OOP family OmpA-OmpF porin